MLYLAEVQRRPIGFGGLGGGRTDLKLLACQRGEHNWTAVPGEEVIPADEAKEFSPGALVLVDLNNNKQVQQIQDAARQLVKILQNFSRSQEKSKTQWEEIEQWKASLTFQAHELNRREIDLQAKEEDLEKLQSEIDKLEEQRQEISEASEASHQFQQQMEQNQKELEAGRLELEKQKEEFEKYKGELSQGAVLDPEQSQYVKDLLNWLNEAITPTDSLGKKLSESLEIVTNQKETLEQHRQQWQNTDNEGSDTQQEDIDSLTDNVQNQWVEWRQNSESLAKITAELRGQESLLASKQDYIKTLNDEIETQKQLYEQLSDVMTSLQNGGITNKVDLEALEKMPLDELKELVQGLQQDLQRDMNFVKDQEEELALQQQEMDALQRRIDKASEYDKINLNSELSDERDRYRILNESLVGSQRNLKEREEILSEHQTVLWSRLGNSSSEGKSQQANIEPIISQVESHKQQLTEELQKLEAEIKQIQSEIGQKEELINEQTQQQEVKRKEIEQLELSLREKQKANMGGGNGVVNQEVILPLEGYVEQLKQQLEEVVGGVEQVQGIGEQLTQLSQVLQDILVQPD